MTNLNNTTARRATGTTLGLAEEVRDAFERKAVLAGWLAGGVQTLGVLIEPTVIMAHFQCDDGGILEGQVCKRTNGDLVFVEGSVSRLWPYQQSLLMETQVEAEEKPQHAVEEKPKAINSLFASHERLLRLLGEKRVIDGYTLSHGYVRGHVEDLAPGGKVCLLVGKETKHFVGRVMYTINCGVCFFEEPSEEGVAPNYIPTIDRKAVRYDASKHHYVESLGVWVEEQTAQKAEFEGGVSCTYSKNFFEEVGDLEGRLKKIVKQLDPNIVIKDDDDTKTNAVRIIRKDGSCTVAFDTIYAARITDLLLTVLETVATIVQAVRVVTGAASVFGFGDSLKKKLNKKKDAVKLRQEQLDR